ncbi:unnamed protein product [Brachionus calyciflorus]|uniref:Uncharacterized protein n=1 Tax=Brachionus calyciflorus TaxID=104777 RepID=A0A814RGH7_9BILA|nr:unnamed protein product [Brachionus calyciflorus]
MPKKIKNRTNDEFRSMARLAKENNETVFGIKGETSLLSIINLPVQAPLDYMHLILQGHAKWLIKQYFFSEKSNDFYIGNSLDKVNHLLKLQKVPHNTSRRIKHIDSKLQFISNELKIFLFYQIIPILIDILPSSYFYMLSSYVFSIRMLYEPIKYTQNLNKVDDLLNKYVSQLDDNFGKYAYDYSVHAHLHLVEQVKNHGPLQCHSQFAFEGALYNLKNLIHGTRGYLGQITNQLLLNKYFCQNLNQELFQNKDLFEFSHGNFYNYKHINYDKNQLLPPFESKNLDQILADKFRTIFNECIDENIITSNRVLYDQKVLHSKNYNRKGDTNIIRLISLMKQAIVMEK